MPIRGRLTVVFTLGTAVLLALVSALFLLTLRGGLTGNLDTTLVTRTSDAVTQLAADPTTTVTTEAGNGIYVQILSTTGAVIDGADVLGDQALVTPSQAHAAATGSVHVDVTLAPGAAGGASDSGPDVVRVVAVGGPDGTVVAAAASRDGVDSAVRRAGIQLLVLDLVLIVVAAAGSWLLARAALRPVESMRRQAAALGTHDHTGIDVPPGRDELARLASTFNDLLGRLRHAVDREQAFVADAGHELRTPLTVLQGELELARRPGRTPSQLRHTVTVAAYETERLVRLSEDLLVLARAGDLDRRRTIVDLVGVVRSAAAEVDPVRPGRDVRLRQDDDGPVAVTVHAPTVRRAVLNIIGNAVRFAPDDTEIVISVTVADGYAAVTVRDHGPGFPPDFLPQAFDRFRQADTTRARNRDGRESPGSGLGLAIVSSIVTAHGGDVTAVNHPSGGALVTMRLPLTSTDGWSTPTHVHDT